MIWLFLVAGIFGGMGLGFILGFFTGAKSNLELIDRHEAWVQARDLRKRREKGEELAKAPPGAAWGGVEIPGKGSEHPSGPIPPTPEQVRNKKARQPTDWTSKLKTGTGGLSVNP